MTHQHHHLVAHILQLLAGGFIGLSSAALANHFGFRSADRMPGETRWPNCYFCLKPFTWQEVFPLFSWLLRPDALKLPCACGRRLGLWPQPVAELAGFGLGFAAVYIAGWPGMSIPLAVGLGLLPALALIDLHFGILPDELNLLLALVGLVFSVMGGGDLYISFIVMAVLLALGLFCALVYSRWRGREMLGIGDVKFFAAAGLWLHPEMVGWFLGVAGFLGVAISYIWQKNGGGKEFPFGPALCLSLMGCLLFQTLKM